MEDDEKPAPVAIATAASSLNPLTYVAVAGAILQIMHEAPALINSVAAFWTAVSGSGSPPAHVENAVQAALATHRAAADAAARMK